ncbi:histidine phosphatase family protein [Amycolatopsis rhabdoformis]|uniref:Histidine phosphatase family protein n=1 Tax=Amycolatopsis rhabdoformis TaxID=1448059 RepID=A0ABZ1IKN6_9PSEU|nr:histidine phosphatase family protein [Amycolatopsis rhabdoformis]WSE34174.1 histidine phosphatase family protein [Amycolatopsis rhabdoformis]
MILHLVRHGETTSYESDAGLTDLGVSQAQHRADELAAALPDGALVAMGYAPTERAKRTAEVMYARLWTESGTRLRFGGCVQAPDFRNLQIRVDGREFEPTQVRGKVAQAGDAEWALEAQRFWEAHEAGDAMGFWLTTPLRFHESPADVVNRFLLAAATAGRREPVADHYVVAAHSGCLRALVAWAAETDPGEPDNAEDVVVALDAAARTVEISYRASKWQRALPHPVVRLLNP